MNYYKNIYPRPQFIRNSFQSLNGIWGLNDDFIEVPYVKQSEISGYKRKKYEKLLEYKKYFTLDLNFNPNKEKLILHLDAVDQECKVFLNNNLLGKHIGSYLPFSFDISNYVKYENFLVVNVKDELNKNYPYGKQSNNPSGMWYTNISGIWGSVWLECVPKINQIKSIKISPDTHSLYIDIDSTAKSFTIDIDFDGQIYSQTFKRNTLYIDLDKCNIKYQKWSPDNPKIYYFTLKTSDDEIKSYFALRKLEAKLINGYQRLYLNDEPIYLNGVLDQGYFEDGIFLPLNSIEYENDIKRMKSLGFNLLRKHIKVEPEIFYYYCDINGMLVMQDFVNNGEFNFFKHALLPNLGLKVLNDHQDDNKQFEIFINHSIETINHLYNHPSIIAWTIFNEGWGQINSDEAYLILKKLDANRLFDSTSGWFKHKNNLSDFNSEHIYFKNKILKSNDKNKILLLSEFGGIARKINGHIFNKRKANYGYGKKASEDELNKAILDIYNEMVIPSIKYGLCGSIYTQLSDVEEEINGLYTYDRKVLKVSKDIMNTIKKEIDKEYKNSLK